MTPEGASGAGGATAASPALSTVPAAVPAGSFILKVTAACNLNCPYCYMFNLRDQTYLGRPRVMAPDVLAAAARRIGEHLAAQQLPETSVTFHGGEPLLAGRDWFREAVPELRRHAGSAQLRLGVQTNATLLDAAWLDLFAELGVSVSVSLDGTPEAHDQTRVDHAGRGTYRATERGLRLLLEHPARAQLFGGVLCVMDPQQSGLAIYRHFRALGIDRMDFLWPLAHNWDDPPARPGAFARYLIPVFDAWWDENDPRVLVRFFFDVLKLLLGGRHHIDALGGDPVNIAVIEVDGSLEPLDALRACGHGLTLTGLNVAHDPVAALGTVPLYQAAVQGQAGLHAGTCGQCDLREVCGGGYLPNRYSRARGFDNPNVYCMDLQTVILHVARRARADADALLALAAPPPSGAFAAP
ncbi:uncharacterized protein SAMN04488058_10376 [Deinococcus reticulitermitis]|uniref:Radical SAM core domain-containing protein n=1 Tax=Deinococcus reticulitermitis TaxID=856736 RepID=A0A1H6V7F3_9DEIO|nr:uncharacterized protein SAMN04488058_10376 [Deinococcus reticulitermitis]